MMMPIILTTMSRGKGLRRQPVAVSIDGFRWEVGSDGSLTLAKQNAALCALLLELCGDSVQRTTLDMEKIMREPATRLHWKHKLYDVSWKMDESLVPEGHRSLARSFQVLVPDSRNENWEYGLVSMLRSNIGSAPVPNPLFEAFLQSAAAGGAAAADSPLPSAPTKRQRVHDGSGVATSIVPEAPVVAPVVALVVPEASVVAPEGSVVVPRMPLMEDPLMGLHAVASGIDLSLPLMTTGQLRSAESARAGGGGAGGCAALSFAAAHAAVGPPSGLAAARLASKMRFEEDDDGGVAAVAAQRACPKRDDEDDLAVAAGARAPSRVGPSLTRASSFDEAKGVSDLLTFAGSVRLHRKEDEPLLSPTSSVLHAFGSLNLHSESDFSDCPLSVIGTLCFHSLPRIREMTEPEGVRSGVRCSFCWRWASNRCIECVSGGTVYAVCDACVERVGLEDVTCLACLPASKKGEGTACVATRIPLKMAV
jgi:hypothetical protein